MQLLFSRHGVLAFGLGATGSFVAAVPLAASGPCDLYAAGNTPCVAAHSTTRALYGSFNGALYQVQRGSDNATTTIAPLSAGGVANAATQDNFCAGTTCLIKTIYDQSGNGNHLTDAPSGGAATGPDDGNDYLAGAAGAPVTLNGQKAYGVFISPGTGYRNNAAKGTATGDNPEGLYAVFDGTHYNDVCCFDYGNAETSSTDTGPSHMEAIYFGARSAHGTGAGSGPWVLADLENGLFSDGADNVNSADPTQTSRFVTAIVKGNSGNQWAIRGGNAASGGLTTYYSGPRPSGYSPMNKEGAIILGIGGDNSDAGQGTFYEGVMTTGYPSTATENSVQQNIVAAKYAVTSLVSGPTLPSIGSSVSFRATTACCTADYITHSGNIVNIQQVSTSSSAALKRQASWTVQTGLGYSGCFSFESVDTPGSYIRHANYELYADANDGSTTFASDATFCPQTGLDGQGNTFRSWSYPSHYWRHYQRTGYLAGNGGPNAWDNPSVFNNDTSFVVTTGFAS